MTNPGAYRVVVPPVLLLVFVRPELVKRQIDILRMVQAPQLFVSIDGPRPDRPDDSLRQQEIFSALETIDWPCDLKVRMSPSNLGLNEAVVSGIGWFFGFVDRGIILEDDCLPRPEFFDFSAELLDYYADDARVMHISGLSMINEPHSKESYITAPIGHIWGWATWRRSWAALDRELSSWPRIRPQVRSSGQLGKALSRKFDACRANRKSRWARWWNYTLIANDGIALVPTVNLVSNEGFGPDATNTTKDRHPLRLSAHEELEFPLRHPRNLGFDEQYMALLARYHARSLQDRTLDRVAFLFRRLRRIPI